jgi:uncharacterized protein
MIDEELDGSGGELWDSAWGVALELGRRDSALMLPLLSHPYTRTWAVRCLDGAAPADHFASLAASVALPAGVVDRITVPVHDGFVHLPGRGRLRSRTPAASIELTPHQVCGPRWEPLRWLDTGGLEVAVDDVDPYRDCFDRPVRGRLTDDEFEQWRHALAKAWTLIRGTLPQVAAAMTAGVRVVTPVVGPVNPHVTSAPGGFAALAAAVVSDPVPLAVDLVRGFRLGVLDALLDLCDLYDETDAGTGALLADTYARTATDALRSGSGSVRRTREQLEELAAAPALTDLGRRFVGGMRRSGG